MIKEESLKKEVGVWGLSANIINIVVGSGIFVLPATVAASLGTSSIFAYLLCGFLVAMVMFCFAEVGSKVTVSGGAYAYIKTAFGPYAGFLTAILFTLSTISADAAVANALLDMLGTVFPFLEAFFIKTVVFLLFFGFLGYINIIGIQQGIKMVKLLTLMKLTPLLVLVLGSWSSVSFDFLTIESIPDFGAIGKVSLVLFFAFQGAETGLSISGEIKNANKTIPKAIFMSILGILILYIGIQTVCTGVLGNTLPDFKESPLSQVAKVVFGPIGFTFITIGAAISMFGIVAGETLSMPRVLFRAAKDQVLPIEQLAKIHPKFQTPYISVIVYVSLGFLFATFGGFEQLAIMSSAAILLVYMGVALSVLVLRKRDKGNVKNTYQAPLGFVIPVLAVLIILAVLSNLSTNEFLVFGIFIGVLSVVYWVKERFLMR